MWSASVRSCPSKRRVILSFEPKTSVRSAGRTCVCCQARAGAGTFERRPGTHWGGSPEGDRQSPSGGPFSFPLFLFLPLRKRNRVPACAAVGGFAAYGCGILLAGADRRPVRQGHPRPVGRTEPPIISRVRYGPPAPGPGSPPLWALLRIRRPASRGAPPCRSPADGRSGRPSPRRPAPAWSASGPG